MANERYSEFIEESPKSYLQGLFEQSATQKHKLGTVRRLSDGREFIYAQAGAANLAAGKPVQTPAFDLANVGNCAVANANVGDRTITVTPVTVAAGDAAANTFAEGFAYIHTGTANGMAYKIKSHGALTANTAANIVLYDKLRGANLVTANSIVSLIRNQCKAVIVHPSPPTSTLVGVPTFPVTANYYAWLQRKGPCPCLIAGTVVVGETVYASNTVDGAVEAAPANAANIVTNPQLKYPVGTAMANNANTNYGMVDIKL